jgi:hypothetical protein
MTAITGCELARQLKRKESNVCNFASMARKNKIWLRLLTRVLTFNHRKIEESSNLPQASTGQWTREKRSRAPQVLITAPEARSLSSDDADL